MEQSPSWEASWFWDSKNAMKFMEPEGSLPHIQDPATCPYLDPEPSSPCPSSHFLKIHFNITHLRMSLPSVLFPLGFPTKA
jgi:hypothetical protein